MKLNLGCGWDKRVGYVNCDISPSVLPDKVINLEKRLPFKKNTVSEILANHVLEHVHNFVPLMHEFWRVCKHGARVCVRTPFYSAWGQFNDPTHVRFFTPFTFDYFKKGKYSHEVRSVKDIFDVKNVVINFGIGPSKKLNFIFNPLINLNHIIYCRFFAWIFPAAEIYYELRVIK